MTTSQYARRPRVRKTRRRVRKRRLCAIPVGWTITCGFVLLAAAKTWPAPTIAILALVVLAVLVGVVQPMRLTGLHGRIARIRHRINRRRRALPNHPIFQLATFERMRPDHFERAIAELAVRSSDVHTASVHGGANDRGRDVLVHLRDGRRILIQCKRYTGKNKVSSEDVQKVNGTWRDIHRCDLAVIVTTSGFTRSAVDTNFMLPTPIRLTDGIGLVSWANGGTPPWR